MEFSKLVFPAILAVLLFAASLLKDSWMEALVGLFPDRIEGVAILNQLQLVVSWILGAWIFTRFVNVIFWRGIVERHSATRVPSLLTDMFANVVAVVAIIGILITAFGLSMVHILVIVAGLTLLLAIFLRKAIEDLFTGISLNFDPSFNIGDVVEVGDGIRGRVQEITWRTARLVTDTQELIAIPNAVIASGIVRNFSRPENQLGSTLRVVLDYSAAPERARRILLNAVREACDDNENCEVHLVELNRQGAVYDVLFWTDSAEKAERTRSHVGEVIVRHLEFAGIALSGGSEAEFEKMKLDSGPSVARLSKVFRSAPIFADLDMATIEELAKEAKRYEFQPGHYLYREGDPGDHMFVITEGRVRIISQREDGTTVVIDEPGPGGTAGVESLLTGEPDKESARVALPTVAYEIGKPAVEAILEKRPEVASKLARKAIEMRRELDRKSNELAAGDTPESQEDVSELLGKIKGVFKSGFLKSLSGYYKDKVSGQTDPVFLEAAMAASALVAAADGEVSESERRQVASVFDTLDIFAADSRSEGVGMFEGFVTEILANPGAGVPLAMVKVKALAGQRDSAETVVRICFAICESDGLTDVDEEKRIREICRALKLPPHDFGL
jgi:small-conductance mechanosensitive channel/tellurite resistance protein